VPTTTPRRSPRHRTRIAVAALATAVLALLPAVLVAPAAAAATPGISAQVLHNGAPLGDGDVVREGDTIVIDIENRSLNVELSNDEIEARLKDWEAPALRYKNGVMAKYCALVRQADQGATTLLDSDDVL